MSYSTRRRLLFGAIAAFAAGSGCLGTFDVGSDEAGDPSRAMPTLTLSRVGYSRK